MTAERLGQDDREQDEDFLSRTMPLPAIDIAGYEFSVQVDYEQAVRPAPVPGPRPAAGP